VKHAPIPKDEPVPTSGKVINLMDALRKSVQGDEAAAAGKKKAPARATAGDAQKGIELVKPVKATKPRKSA
jgi:DNA end-binding protein Ku